MNPENITIRSHLVTQHDHSIRTFYTIENEYWPITTILNEKTLALICPCTLQIIPPYYPATQRIKFTLANGEATYIQNPDHTDCDPEHDIFVYQLITGTLRPNCNHTLSPTTFIDELGKKYFLHSTPAPKSTG